MLRPLALILSFALVVGCSDGDDGDGMTGPSVPNIAGNWNGDFRGANVTASLQQSGSTVTGTMSFGGNDYAITGTVDEFGIFSFSGTSTAAGTCLSVNSAVDDLALSQMDSHMEGVVQHRTPSDCDGGGRTFVQQGTMELNKVGG